MPKIIKPPPAKEEGITARMLSNRLFIAFPDIPIYVIDPITGYEVPLRVSFLDRRSIGTNAVGDLPVRILIANRTEKPDAVSG